MRGSQEEASCSEARRLLAHKSLPSKPSQRDDHPGPSYGAAATKDSSLSPEHHMFLRDGRRHYCLDVARIVCVGLVAVNHGGSSWSDQFGLWNEMYVQQWTLQWLFIICGISFAMSSRSTCGYLSRLALYFCIGVFTNWCAWVITGQDWKGQFWNVIFQFWFIFGLMIYIIVLAPLKHYLDRVSRGAAIGLTPDRDIGLMPGIALMISVLMAIHLSFRYAIAPFMDWSLGSYIVAFVKSSGKGAAFWGLPQHEKEAYFFCQEIASYAQVSAGSIMILVFFPFVSKNLTFANWLVLMNVYIFRCLTFRSQFARMSDGFDFTMLGMSAYYLGLAYRRTIGKYMMRYWWLLLFVFSLLLPPGTFGRYDETPQKMDESFRLRYHVVELALVVMFLCAAERMADDGIFTEDRCQWLSWWALYVFLFHKFIHMVVPVPYNWVVLVLSCPVTYLIHGWGRPSEVKGGTQEPTESHRKDIESTAEEAEAQTKDVESPPDSPDCPALTEAQVTGR